MPAEISLDQRMPSRPRRSLEACKELCSTRSSPNRTGSSTGHLMQTATPRSTSRCLRVLCALGEVVGEEPLIEELDAPTCSPPDPELASRLSSHLSNSEESAAAQRLHNKETPLLPTSEYYSGAHTCGTWVKRTETGRIELLLGSLWCRRRCVWWVSHPLGVFSGGSRSGVRAWRSVHRRPPSVILWSWRPPSAVLSALCVVRAAEVHLKKKRKERKEKRGWGRRLAGGASDQARRTAILGITHFESCVKQTNKQTKEPPGGTYGRTGQNTRTDERQHTSR